MTLIKMITMIFTLANESFADNAARKVRVKIKQLSGKHYGNNLHVAQIWETILTTPKA